MICLSAVSVHCSGLVQTGVGKLNGFAHPDILKQQVGAEQRKPVVSQLDHN